MVVRWEHRVRGALVSQPGVPLSVRASAGLLVVRSRMRRWLRRAAIAVTAIVGMTVMAAPFVAAVVALMHVL